MEPRKKGDGNDGSIGRSRGWLTNKIHALVDAEGRPVMLHLTGGQVADCTQADALSDGLSEGDILLADKGYDTDALRAITTHYDKRPENYLAAVKIIAARI